MRVKVVSIVIALTGCFLAACGSSAPKVPGTPANLAVCKVLTQALAGKASVQQLAGMVLESNAPLTQRLRQDIASYAALAATAGPGAAQQAQTKAEQDCAVFGAG